MAKALKRRDEAGRANGRKVAFFPFMGHRSGEVRGPALQSTATLQQLAILVPILGAMVGGCATLKGGGYQEAQVEQDAAVIYLERALESYLADSTLVAETRSTMEDSWDTFKNALDAVLQSVPDWDTIPAIVDSMRLATATREDAWRKARAKMESNALAVHRADSAHRGSLSQYEYQLLNAAGNRSALDSAWTRHAPSLQTYQASFDTLTVAVLAADNAELDWHAAYIDYVKVLGAVNASNADVSARLAMGLLNEEAYDSARTSYAQARDRWKTSSWRFHVFAKERQLAAKTQVAINDRVTFGGVLRAAGGAVLVATATAGAAVGDATSAAVLMDSAEEMLGWSDVAREEDAKSAAYDLARAERRALADRGATTAELMGADDAVAAAADEWLDATENAIQERLARSDALMAASMQSQDALAPYSQTTGRGAMSMTGNTEAQLQAQIAEYERLIAWCRTEPNRNALGNTDQMCEMAQTGLAANRQALADLQATSRQQSLAATQQQVAASRPQQPERATQRRQTPEEHDDTVGVGMGMLHCVDYQLAMTKDRTAADPSLAWTVAFRNGCRDDSVLYWVMASNATATSQVTGPSSQRLRSGDLVEIKGEWDYTGVRGIGAPIIVFGAYCAAEEAAHTATCMEPVQNWIGQWPPLEVTARNWASIRENTPAICVTYDLQETDIQRSSVEQWQVSFVNECLNRRTVSWVMVSSENSSSGLEGPFHETLRHSEMLSTTGSWDYVSGDDQVIRIDAPPGNIRGAYCVAGEAEYEAACIQPMVDWMESGESIAALPLLGWETIEADKVP